MKLKTKLKLLLSVICDVWIKCEEIMPNECGEDWVLVQFVDKLDGFVGIPYIAEYSPITKDWHTQFADASRNEFLNKECYASSWKPIGHSNEWRKRYKIVK